MDERDTTIKQLERTIKSLEQQVNNLTEMILLLRKEKFGSSSEKTPKPVLSGQICLFNEAEAEADPSAPEPVVKDINGYKRRNPKSRREERLKDLPVKEILCEIHEDDQNCLRCNTLLRPIGKETVREELEYIPAKLQIIRYVRMAYECPQCKHTDTPYIEKALTPSPLMAHSLASPSTVAHVMYQKYVNAMPLYRQEKDWEQLGFSLSRATMANWIIRCSQDYLNPIIAHLREKLRQREILHCDETPVQVLKEEGKKPQSKSTMWLYRTGNDGKASIILYDYRKSKVDVPEFIDTNLASTIELREYQIRAFQNFITYYENDKLRKNKQVHTLFHMATGSGKTVIMAGLILYLYAKGYRRFLFFVNQTSILEKTKLWNCQ